MCVREREKEGARAKEERERESKSLSFGVNVIRVISADLRQSRLVFFFFFLRLQSEVTYVSDLVNLRSTHLDMSVSTAGSQCVPSLFQY